MKIFNLPFQWQSNKYSFSTAVVKRWNMATSVDWSGSNSRFLPPNSRFLPPHHRCSQSHHHLHGTCKRCRPPNLFVDSLGNARGCGWKRNLEMSGDLGDNELTEGTDLERFNELKDQELKIWHSNIPTIISTKMIRSVSNLNPTSMYIHVYTYMYICTYKKWHHYLDHQYLNFHWLGHSGSKNTKKKRQLHRPPVTLQNLPSGHWERPQPQNVGDQLQLPRDQLLGGIGNTHTHPWK